MTTNKTPETPETPKPAGGKPWNRPMGRGLRVLLIVSLALNLLIAGMIAGRAFSGRGPGPFGHDMTLGEFSRVLGHDDRRALLRDMRDRPELRRLAGRDRGAVTEALITALRTEPFDPTAVEAILAQERERAVDGMRAAQEAFLRRLAAVTPEERAAIADRLEHSKRRHRN